MSRVDISNNSQEVFSTNNGYNYTYMEGNENVTWTIHNSGLPAGEAFEVDAFNVTIDENGTELTNIENGPFGSNTDFYVFVVDTDNRTNKSSHGFSNLDLSLHAVGWNGSSFTSYGQFTALQTGNGSTGPTGPTGSSGSKGEKGQKGMTGATGPKGEKGQKGMTGFTGPKGEKGMTGFTGPNGEKGMTGFTGPKGEKGMTGFTGPKGEKGQKGMTGATGFTGQKGAEGDTGAKGDAGAKGQQADFSPWENSGSDIYFSGGNVGIGTSSPDQLLQVKGANSDYPAMRLSNDNANFDIMMTGSSFNDVLFTNRANGNILFETTGNVGIGTTAPASKLDVNGSIRGAYDSDTMSFFGHAAIGGSSHAPNHAYISHIDQQGANSYALRQNPNGTTVINSASGQHLNFRINNSTKIHIDSGGNVGIGTTNPGYGLERKFGDTDNQAFHGDFYHGNAGGYGWKWTYDSNHGGGGQYNYYGSAAWWVRALNNASTTTYKEVGYFAGAQYYNNIGVIDFTGQHRCFVDNIKHNEAVNYRGLIVCADKNEYINIESKPERGNKGIMINESLPLVSLSTKHKDKSCFGVISDSEDPETRSHSNGSILTSIFEKEIGDTRIYINSVGEGAIWIIDAGGNLESGDYITTSSVPGYGVVQESEFLANYTVAKITMDCNFNPALQPVKTIKKKNLLDSLGNQIYNGSGSIIVEKNPDGFEVVNDPSSGTIVARKEKNEDIFYEMSDGSYTTDTTGYKIKIYTVSGTTIIDNLDNVVYDYNGGDAKLTNDLDSNGDFQWENTTEQEYAYNIRYVDATGTILTESEYTTKKAAGETVFKAAFVGCTYHCG